MIAATVSLSLALLVAAEPEATALVARLGAAPASEQRAVAAQIEALGPKALPALRAAKGSKDPELRRRASALLEKVETGLLIRPSLVALDFQEQPPAEVIRSIHAQTGISLVLEPPGNPAWQTVRISLKESQPLPFWEALDRIGSAGRLHHDPSFPRPADERTPILHLVEGATTFPRSFSGPFRTNLLSVHRRHDLAFGPKERADDEEDEPEPEPERFEVVAQVFAEPQLLITLNGPPKELKARDDFDQDLVPPPPELVEDPDGAPEPGGGPGIERGPGRVPGALAVVQFPIALHAPERPGTTIERLEGFIPLQVAMRRPDPLTITLAEAAGRTFETDELSVRLPEGKLDLTSREPLELFVTLKAPANALPPDETPAPPDFPEPRPVDTLQNRLEVVDSKNRPLAFRIKDVQRDDSGESRVLIVLSAREGSAQPVQLHVYSLVLGAIEVPFKFTKIPMP
ncbi:MAG: hypothetical protein P4L84_36765 [Isosphaeraceae bacterium]|nr:hypothetical protein [Isosphaeraceae bacterium]